MTKLADAVRHSIDILLRVLTAILSVVLVTSCGGPMFPFPTTEPDLERSAQTIAVDRGVIARENARPGTADWRIISESFSHEVEGYASATSIGRGGSIDFFVSTDDPTYTLDVFRMGWYGGLGARRMLPSVTLAGGRQEACPVDSNLHFLECHWRSSYSLRIPDSADHSEWASGVYLVKLSGLLSGKQSYITFVVRDDVRKSDVLMQTSVTTYQAYNTWGGYSLYTKPRALKVSFDRPYTNGVGAGDFRRWEYSMVRFLERENYDVTYSTDIDTHLHAPLNHKAFLVVGHDEYWSWEMRDHVELARDSRVHLGFFAANVGFFQIRLEPSSTGVPNRVQVCYKNAHDPYSDFQDERQHFTTVEFRKPIVGRPEATLVGVMYRKSEGEGIDTGLGIDDEKSWVFEGTGLRKNEILPGLVGYETDEINKHSPANIQRVTHSVFKLKGHRLSADSAYYQATSGATVFASGSMQWNWGLDLPGDNIPGHFDRGHAAIIRATENVLHRFGVDRQ